MDETRAAGWSIDCLGLPYIIIASESTVPGLQGEKGR